MSGWVNMAQRVAAYLEARRAMGFELSIAGTQLQSFAKFADQQGHTGPVTLKLALEWASQSCSATNIGPARRLEVIRPLTRYCALFEPDTEIPPSGCLGPAHRRVMPYIYSDREIANLMQAAHSLSPGGGLRPASIRCLIGLLACTGLRISEALALERTDIDWQRGLLQVSQTKFRKSRYVPVSQTTQQALEAYADLRDRCLPRPRDSAFLLFDNGHAVTGAQARYAFNSLRAELPWDQPEHVVRPRLYDLRHTFACRRLQTWHEEGRDVNSLLPHLATYLGHARVSDTYWYLTGTVELLTIAAGRSERFVQHSTGESS
jgi:integrase/recombinase XerD